MVKVRRSKRGHRPFGTKNTRSRSSCPNCGSVNIRKRITTMDYICYRCGWKGDIVIKIDY